MKYLYSFYIGINGCLRRVRECFFWLGMSVEIKEYIVQCEICSQCLVKQFREILMSYEFIDRLWEKVVVDIYIIDGKDYFIIVDYFFNFQEVDRFRDIKVFICVRKLKSYFVRNGIFDVVILDNGL